MLTNLQTLLDRYRTQPLLLRLGLAVILGITLGVGGLIVISEVALANRIYPGVSAGSVNLSGLTVPQAEAALTSAAAGLAYQGITVSVGAERLSLKPGDLELNYDYTGTARAALAIGHNANFLISLKERLTAVLVGKPIPAQFKFEEGKLNQVVSKLAKGVDIPPVDAGISLKNAVVTVTPSKVGAVLDQGAVIAAVKSALDKIVATSFNFQPGPSFPSVFEADAEVAKREAEQAIASPVKLTWRGQSWVLDSDKIGTLLSFSASQTQANTINLALAGQNFKIGQIRLLASGETVSDHSQLHLGLNSEALSSYVQTLAKSIDQTAVDAKFNYVDGKIQAFSAEREGRVVDREALSAALIAKLSSSSERQVEIPVRVSPPRVTLAALNSFGIKELIGRGVSRYAGSSAARIQNLSTGAVKVNGTLVPPGETFSMYQAVGDISPETGYAVGLIIANGRTVPGVGGGICQVSTTLFRAALNAGLPILERNPHAYRVGYYEQNSAPGVDASVYFPYSDFRFKNDTGGYVLIQALNDPASATLTFDIYGTSDGRQVSVTTPIVSNNIPAPAPLYQNDDTLPKGVTKQVDYAAPGATTVFNRTITKGGVVVANDSFYTKYQPWQAIFLVGTKES